MTLVTPATHCLKGLNTSTYPVYKLYFSENFHKIVSFTQRKGWEETLGSTDLSSTWTRMAEWQTGMISPGSHCTERTGTYPRPGAFLKIPDWILLKKDKTFWTLFPKASLRAGRVARAGQCRRRAAGARGGGGRRRGRMLRVRDALAELRGESSHSTCPHAGWLQPVSLAIHSTSIKVSHKMIN